MVNWELRRDMQKNFHNRNTVAVLVIPIFKLVRVTITFASAFLLRSLGTRGPSSVLGWHFLSPFNLFDVTQSADHGFHCNSFQAWLSSGFSAEYRFILWALELSPASLSSLSSCRRAYSDVLSFTFLGATGTFAKIGIFSVSNRACSVCFLNRQATCIFPVWLLFLQSCNKCGDFGGFCLFCFKLGK